MFVSLWIGSREQRRQAGQYVPHGDRMRDARVYSLNRTGQRAGVYARVYGTASEWQYSPGPVRSDAV